MERNLRAGSIPASATAVATMTEFRVALLPGTGLFLGLWRGVASPRNALSASLPTGTQHADFGGSSPDRSFKPTGRRVPIFRLPIPMDALARRAAVSLPTGFWLLADWGLERPPAHSPSPTTPVHAGNAGRNDGDGCNASLRGNYLQSPLQPACEILPVGVTAKGGLALRKEPTRS